MSIEYLPGKENGFADALSREERKRVTPAIQKTDVSLAVGDVGVSTRLRRKPCNGEYPGKKKETLSRTLIS